MLLLFESAILDGLKSTLAETASHPIRTAVALACLSLIWATFKNIVARSHYRNLVGPPSTSFVYGHLRELFGLSAVSFHDHLQDAYGSVAKVKGTFGTDQLYITDPRAMQEILVKEHDAVFRHPQFTYDFFSVTFGPGLATATGNMHKAQRRVTHFHSTAQELKDALTKELGETGSADTDVLHWCSSAALELIGLAGGAGLGHTFGLFQGIHSAYSVAIKDFLPTFVEIAPYRALFSLVYNYVPSVALRRKIVQYAPIASVQRMRKIIEIQGEQAQAVLNKRKDVLKYEQDVGESNDLLSAILKSNTASAEIDKLPDDQVLGQINTMIFAGHETTSGALTRVLDVLSQNLEVQSRLRKELDTASPTASYDEIQSLPLLEAVCREILRLYPPAISLERRSSKDCVVPLRYPAKTKDGHLLHEIKIAKGTHIYLGIREANRCKDIWGEDADEFRPERWLEPLPQSVTDAKVPGVYQPMMTFGAGSRACIGFKFSVLELKIILSALIRSFEFSPSTSLVEWRFTGAMAPYVVGSNMDHDRAQLPLHVTLVA
ncbi:cytochrome P450 family protein [Ceratobasidium sp. AG-Ba]|nr:cytochrome P450 family protein [Ceratobasidium sp. AG-Ba]QRW07634.1 cytochrome P450 family protein [Ceratobasidium sp. AG-Ba]